MKYIIAIFLVTFAGCKSKSPQPSLPQSDNEAIRIYESLPNKPRISIFFWSKEKEWVEDEEWSMEIEPGERVHGKRFGATLMKAMESYNKKMDELCKNRIPLPSKKS